MENSLKWMIWGGKPTIFGNTHMQTSVRLSPNMQQTQRNQPPF